MLFCSADLEDKTAACCSCTPNLSVCAFVNLHLFVLLKARRSIKGLTFDRFPFFPSTRLPQHRLQAALQLGPFLIHHMILLKYSPVLPLLVAKKPTNRKQKKREEKTNKAQNKTRNTAKI